MAVYGYARCSTNENRQDVKRQVYEMMDKYDVPKSNIYFEYASGAKAERKVFLKLLSQLQEKDTLISSEVSRLTRSTKQLCEVLEIAKEKKLKLIIGDFVVDCSKGELDPMTNGMLMMMGVFAEMERNMTRARIKSGLEYAKENGVVLGRPTTGYEDLPNAFLKHYPKTQLPKDNPNRLSVPQIAKLCGISKQTAYKYKEIYDDYYKIGETKKEQKPND